MIIFYIYVGSILLNFLLFHILRYIDEDFKEEFKGDEGIFVCGAGIPLANIILLIFLCKTLIISLMYNTEDY